MKSSEMLRKVASTLWDGTGNEITSLTYICVVLQYCILDDSKHIRCLINERLCGMSVNEWLRRKGLIDNNTPNTEIQAYRKRWCLALSDEYEAKGD